MGSRVSKSGAPGPINQAQKIVNEMMTYLVRTEDIDMLSLAASRKNQGKI